MRMTSIDTEFTLGRLAAERDRILRVLAAEGMVERNGALPFPAVPLRVGLVTSVGSAAHADFLHEIEASGFAFHVVVADARVQGAEAEASLVGALAAACAAGAEVVAIVRGGGSRLDLATFDREVVARAVALAPVPVITGIGHETDDTVVDRVAAAAYKTPTACAAALVARVAGFVRSLDGAAARLSGVTRSATALGTRRLDDGSARLRRAAGVALGRRNVEIVNRARRVGRGGAVAIRDSHQAVAGRGRRVLAAADRHQVHRDMEIQACRARLAGAPRALARSMAALDSAAARVQSLDPRRVLARGWSITRDWHGRVVRAVSAVGPGELLATTVFDGVVTSRVEEASATTLPMGGVAATIGGEEAG
jgi:exodeoxyribonuclease VII large subunit